MNHMYKASPRINLEAMRREARKRRDRDGRETVIHLHPSDDGECNYYDEHHEFYSPQEATP